MLKKITLLGSTGSVGTQSLEVCRNLSCRVVALTAGSDVEKLAQQAHEFRPEVVAIADKSRYMALKTALQGLDVRILAGVEGICEAAALTQTDVVINSIVGIAGLRPTIAALEAGNTLALANKEALIAGGELVTRTARANGAAILPVDSEHSAILQCLQAGRREDVRGVILTASGGPFVGKTREELAGVTIQDALAHPNWSMGAKITVDCATLMNKGLEFIEAMWLFNLKPEQIEIVVHRQSVVHSAVEYADGSVIAQLSVPDMRCAIQYAVTYPAHLPLPGKRLSLPDYGKLTFEKPDTDVFACLALCIQAAQRGGTAPCIVNGANEQAVELFLQGKIGFLRIAELVGLAAGHIAPTPAATLAQIEQADALAREYVKNEAAKG